MKFEKLTDNKLRIIFTTDDMNLNNVSTNAILSNSDSSQKLLQMLLAKAEQEVGFNSGDCNLIVEAISIKDGFIFNVTKVSTNCDLLLSSNLLCQFDSFEDFLDFSTYLKNMNFYDYNGFHLFLYNEKYYLSIPINNALTSDFKLILCEFGNIVNNSLCMNGILNEYGRVVFDEFSFSDNLKLFIQ